MLRSESNDENRNDNSIPRDQQKIVKTMSKVWRENSFKPSPQRVYYSSVFQVFHFIFQQLLTYLNIKI